MIRSHGELGVVLRDEEVGELLGSVVAPGVVVGHDVVVQVVVTPEPDEQNGTGDDAGRRRRVAGGGAVDLADGRLEVLDLLVERYPANLNITSDS